MVFKYREIRVVCLFTVMGENMVVGVIAVVLGDEIQAKGWKGNKLVVNLCQLSVSNIWLMFKLVCKSVTTFKHKHTVWYAFHRTFPFFGEV